MNKEEIEYILTTVTSLLILPMPVSAPPRLAIIVPCYNEEAIITTTLQRLEQVLKDLAKKKAVTADSFICCVDDGSRDRTWELLTKANLRGKTFRALKLSRNFGHQNALVAGLLFVKNYADCCITIDADLQQDEKAIAEFITEYRKGAHIVFGIRRNRATDSWLKRVTANFFYGLMRLSGAEIIKHHADYRLVSRKALEAFCDFQEVNLFLRGLFTAIGFKTATVYFDVSRRNDHSSRYSFKKMVNLALDGITSFTVRPLRMVAIIGFAVFLVSILMASFFFIYTVKTHQTVPGWASIVIPIYVLGGIQLFCIGIVGEYIGKIYQETKHRPKFIIEETLE